jgi:hypothetical protein
MIMAKFAVEMIPAAGGMPSVRGRKPAYEYYQFWMIPDILLIDSWAAKEALYAQHFYLS